jgi:hypothetical protein
MKFLSLIDERLLDVYRDYNDVNPTGPCDKDKIMSE